MTSGSATDGTSRTGPPKKRGFTLPSAYTILFILIVAVAAADVDHPGRPLRLQRGRHAHPGHVPHRAGEPGADHQRLARRRRSTACTASRAPTARISFYNSGELFGAIDVALFILVIGGFLGVTMKTGAIQTGISRVVERLKGRERLMIPILMALFALGGTTYGMAEESLAFYALVITVMIAAGYDSLVGASHPAARLRHRRARLDHQPVRDRHRVGLRGRQHRRGPGRAHRDPRGRHRDRHLVGDALRGQGARPHPETSLLGADMRDVERRSVPGRVGSRRCGTCDDDPHASSSCSLLFFLAFVVMIIGVVPWADLGIDVPPDASTGGSPR